MAHRAHVFSLLSKHYRKIWSWLQELCAAHNGNSVLWQGGRRFMGAAIKERPVQTGLTKRSLEKEREKLRAGLREINAAITEAESNKPEKLSLAKLRRRWAGVVINWRG